MSDVIKFLNRVVDRLEAARVPYMVCGSVASGLHGEMRQTQDLDILIDPTGAEFARLIGSLSGEFYVDEIAARRAFEHREMFNAIDLVTLWKADFMLLKDQPFHHCEFDRATPISVEGRSIRVSTPEDVILSKLVWAKMSDSERQMRDVVTVIKHRYKELDLAYLDRWASRLGVSDRLAIVMRDGGREQARGDELV